MWIEKAPSNSASSLRFSGVQPSSASVASIYVEDGNDSDDCISNRPESAVVDRVTPLLNAACILAKGPTQKPQLSLSSLHLAGGGGGGTSTPPALSLFHA